MTKSNEASTAMAAINAQAKSIVGALGAFDKAAAKTAATIKTAMQRMVDSWTATVAADVDKRVSANALAKHIRDCETFTKAVALGSIERKTITEYAQGAARAFYHGVEWTPRLKNDPDMVIPSGKPETSAASGNEIKSGAVKSTTREAVDQTAKKLLEQLRMIGCTECAAEVLDVLLESLDGFKE